MDDICIIPLENAATGETTEYPLSPRHITAKRLMALKSKFGPEYGIYTSLLNLFLQGDGAAVIGMTWIAMQAAGAKRNIDSIDLSPFVIFEAIRSANTLKEEAEEDPLAEDDGETNDSTKTPETSETSTSEF